MFIIIKYFVSGGRRRKLRNVAVMAVCWSLWLERNGRRFNDVVGDEDGIWEMIKYWIAIWIFNSKEFKDLSLSVLCQDRSL